MAAPVYVDGDTVTSAAALNLTPTIPAGAGTGDLMIALAYQSENTTQRIWDDDGGGGNDWIQFGYLRSTSGRDRETAIYYKIHTGSETNPTFTWATGITAEPMTCILLVYSGCDSVNPITDWGILTSTNDCNPPNPSVITPAANNRVVVFHAATHDDISSVGAPSGYTLREYQYGGSSGHTSDHRDSFSADAEIDTIGAYTPGDWTHGASNTTPEYHTYTIVLGEPALVHISDVNTDEQIDLAETGVTITGDGFKTTQSTGKIEIWSDVAGTIKVEQTATT